MMYKYNEKVMTSEQVITRVYNKYTNEYNNYQQKQEKQEIIHDLLSEVEYVHFTTQDESEREEEYDNITNQIFSEQDVFSMMELLTIVSILAQSEVVRV